MGRAKGEKEKWKKCLSPDEILDLMPFCPWNVMMCFYFVSRGGWIGVLWMMMMMMMISLDQNDCLYIIQN